MSIATVPAGAAGDFEQIAVSTVVVTPTAAKITIGPIRAGRAWIDLDAAGAIRFTIDGSTPSATVGANLLAGTRLVLETPTDVANLKMIRLSADTVANVIYFRERDTGGLLG